MADWPKVESYIRLQGLQDLLEFDRANVADQPMVRLAALAKKVDALCKRDPEFAKFASGTGLFSSLQELVKSLHQRQSEGGNKS